MSDQWKIYLSGRIAGTDNPDANTRAKRLAYFAEVAEQLKATMEAQLFGAAIIVNPVEVGACTESRSFCPGSYTEGPEDSGKHTWSCYLRHDLIALLDCHEILMLPGWQDSPGARFELEVAAKLGMGVFYWDGYSDRAVQHEITYDPQDPFLNPMPEPTAQEALGGPKTRTIKCSCGESFRANEFDAHVELNGSYHYVINETEGGDDERF